MSLVKRRGRKRNTPPSGESTIERRLRELRDAAGVSQEAIGSQGFVSTPGWIKLENGQRSPSEKLLAALASWLVREEVVRLRQKAALIEELTALKYAGHRSVFVSTLAKNHLLSLDPITLQRSSHQNRGREKIEE